MTNREKYHFDYFTLENYRRLIRLAKEKGLQRSYAIDSSKLQHELGWEPSLQFEEGIEKTVRWYLDNEAWMDNVTCGDYQKYYEQMYANR
jgi:dTDP-glucose 4,6-dehydratase